MPLLYDLFMVFVITLSLLPLIIKEDYTFLYGLDSAVIFIFGLDYLLQTYWNYRYCTTLIGIIDFLSLIPFLPWARFFKLLRLCYIFRALKLFRFCQNSLLFRVLKKQKTALLLIWSIAVCYLFFIAVCIFVAEPQTFENFFEALYWAVTTVTSVGYGDIVPVTYLGRVITMISVFLGTAFISIPSGIIAAGYMDELNKS